MCMKNLFLVLGAIYLSFLQFGCTKSDLFKVCKYQTITEYDDDGSLDETYIFEYDTDGKLISGYYYFGISSFYRAFYPHDFLINYDNSKPIDSKYLNANGYISNAPNLLEIKYDNDFHLVYYHSKSIATINGKDTAYSENKVDLIWNDGNLSACIFNNADTINYTYYDKPIQGTHPFDRYFGVPSKNLVKSVGSTTEFRYEFEGECLKKTSRFSSNKLKEYFVYSY